MGEEKILKIIKDYIDNGMTDKAVELDTVLYLDEAIKELYSMYQTEKEKNKELENSDLTTVYMKGFYDAKNKYKDKIRAKIEEVKRKREEEWETAGISMLGSAIDVLIELLEEEQK